MSKVIVITGAGSGLGRALARRFGIDGEKVVLLGRTLSNLEKVAAEIGENAQAIACDVGSAPKVRTAFAKIAETYPKIDVLINNAAMINFSTLADASDEHIIGMVATNLTGALFCTRSAIAMMGKGGHIINVSSDAVDLPFPHELLYQTTKGGLETMSKHLQNELRPEGIRVSVVRAGAMYDADQTIQASPDAMRHFREACMERGIDLSRRPISHFSSVLWIFRSLIDMPADVHVETVSFGPRHA